MSGANGMITFNCGSAPVVITVTDNGETGAASLWNIVDNNGIKHRD